MENKNIIYNYLKKKGYNLKEDPVSDGMNIVLNDTEVVIKGTKLDLIELADLIISVALLGEAGSHVHIDDLTLLSVDSAIEDLIIEKTVK